MTVGIDNTPHCIDSLVCGRKDAQCMLGYYVKCIWEKVNKVLEGFYLIASFYSKKRKISTIFVGKGFPVIC